MKTIDFLHLLCFLFVVGYPNLFLLFPNFNLFFNVDVNYAQFKKEKNIKELIRRINKKRKRANAMNVDV